MRTAPRPILLGVVGDSAAGKTTLMRGLASLLGPERVTLVCCDDYHRFDRAERARLGITPLHPDCNYIDILELHVERLHYGQPILKPMYDHATGRLVRPVYLQPRSFVLLDGLLAFHTAVLRQFYDVKVYLDPPEDLRRLWKMRRDTAKRGYRREEVLAELARREPDARDFVRPQREHADVVVRFAGSGAAPLEDGDSRLDARLVLRATLPHPDLGGLFDGTESDAGIRLHPGREGNLDVDVLEIPGNVTPQATARLKERIWRHLPDLPQPTGSFGDYQDRDGLGHSEPLAVTQLLLLYHLLRERSGLAPRRFARPVAALSRLHLPEDEDVPARRSP